MATQTKTRQKKKVAFLAARNEDLKVIVKPARQRHKTDAGGNVIETTGIPGKYAQFENFRFSTDDPEIIEHLREHDRFESEGGWYEDFDASRDPQDDVFAEIQDLAIAGDRKGIEELREKEAKSGKGGRPPVLAQADRALLALPAGSEVTRTGDKVPKERKEAQENPVEDTSAFNSEHEPVEYASAKAKTRAWELQVIPEALREHGLPSSEKGYTVEDVEKTARLEGKLQEPEEPAVSESVDPREGQGKKS